MRPDFEDEPRVPSEKDCREEFARVETNVRNLLESLHLDLFQPDLRDTPSRVAKMYFEIFAGTVKEFEPKITVFPNEENYRSMVLVRDVPFYSMCAHHLVPFFGVGHLAYLPGERIAGLSKLARILEFFARRPQVQERLTEQVADFLVTKLDPRGVMVVLEARHLCMEMRGVEKPGTLTITSTVRGLFSDAERGGELREEFMQHINRIAAVPR